MIVEAAVPNGWEIRVYWPERVLVKNLRLEATGVEVERMRRVAGVVEQFYRDGKLYVEGDDAVLTEVDDGE